LKALVGRGYGLCPHVRREVAMQEEPSFAIPNIEELQDVTSEPDRSSGTSTVAVVLAKHHDALMARPGVVMVGETLNATGKSAIIIGVKTRADLRGLPQQIDGVPVIWQVIGDVDALPR
jgi:hypothetical protein